MAEIEKCVACGSACKHTITHGLEGEPTLWSEEYDIPCDSGLTAERWVRFLFLEEAVAEALEIARSACESNVGWDSPMDPSESIIHALTNATL